MPGRHRRLSVTGAPKELAIAVLGHPSGTGEMGIVDVACPFRVVRRVDLKKNGHNFTPIRTVGGGVQQAQIEFRMRPVIICQRRTFRRLIEEIVVSHLGPPSSKLAVLSATVNHIGFEKSR